MDDNMRGLFFIVKGQYKKSARPSVVNSVSKDTMWLGGYDPYNADTEEWYMLMDNKTFHCVMCGSDLKKVLQGVYDLIIRYDGVAKKYFKHVSSTTSDDYYETHYLGHQPLTHDQRVKKAEGRCPRVSPVMRCLYESVFKEYGDFYIEEVEEMENKAYNDLKTKETPKKTKKLIGNRKVSNGHKGVTKTETNTKVEGVTTLKTFKNMKTKTKVLIRKS